MGLRCARFIDARRIEILKNSKKVFKFHLKSIDVKSFYFNKSYVVDPLLPSDKKTGKEHFNDLLCYQMINITPTFSEQYPDNKERFEIHSNLDELKRRVEKRII